MAMALCMERLFFLFIKDKEGERSCDGHEEVLRSGMVTTSEHWQLQREILVRAHRRESAGLWGYYVLSLDGT